MMVIMVVLLRGRRVGYAGAGAGTENVNGAACPLLLVALRPWGLVAVSAGVVEGRQA